MANFPPLKDRFLLALDDVIARFGVTGPFLDFGAGSGDVAAHLARRHGFNGVLVETSETCRARYAVTPEIAGLPSFKRLEDVPTQGYSLVLAFDVLEHLEDPVTPVRVLRELMSARGVFVAVVPYRPRAWGWDDEFYGHLRRWTRWECQDLLRACGLSVVHEIDPTFPVYSLMRKIMLAWRRPPLLSPDTQTATRCSAIHNAWGEVPSWANWRAWRGVNRLSRLTERIFLGDELFVVARRAAP